MEKIINQFIKDFDNLNKRDNYILDFKNNIVNYKNVALYKANLSMFNYDFMCEHNVKLIDMNKILENENDNILKEECFIKRDGLTLIEYRLLDNLIHVDSRYVKLITEECYVKGLSDRYPLFYYSKKTDELEAIILPVRIRGLSYGN